MKVRNAFIICITCICISFTSFSNPPIESLYSTDTLLITTKAGIIQSHKEITKILQGKEVLKKAELFYNTGYALANKKNQSTKSLQTALQYISISSEYYLLAKNMSQYCVCLENIATINYELMEYEKSIANFQKSLEIYQSDFKDDISHIAILNNNLAFIFFNTFRYENALSFFTKALDLYIQLNDTLNIGKNLYYKGLVFNENNELDSTIYYYEKALKYDLLLKNNEEIIASYNNIGITHTKKKNYNQAISYFEKADFLIEKLEDKKSHKAIQYNNYGNVFFYKKMYDKSIDFYNKSLDLKREAKDNEGIAICLHNIANVYIEQGKLTEAKNKLHEALALSETAYPNKLFGSICKTTSRLYEIIKNPEKALYYYELFIANTISILSDDTEQLSESDTKYDNGMFAAASIQREIKMQEMLAAYDLRIKKDSINSLEEKRKADRTRIYIFVGILIFILLAIGILFNRYLVKKKANLKLENQNKEIAEQNIVIAEQTDALLESNRELEKLSIVASKTDNAILIMNHVGDFEWVNEAYTKIFGFTFDELCTNISTNMIGASTPQYIIDKYKECTEHHKTVQYEVETKNKAKESIWIQVTLTPILNEKGELHRLVMIDSDITLAKKAELEITAQKEQIENLKEEQSHQRDIAIEQSKEIEAKKEQLAQTLEQLTSAQNKLVESEKMAALGSLVAGISHEINTPVGVGTAASTTLSTRVTEIIELFDSKKMKLTDLQAFLETAQNACDLILKNLTRTAELVKSFNQVSVDNMTEQKRTFNLNEYLHDITRSLAPKFKGRQVDYTITCNNDIELTSYPGAFAQIFTNFIINSLTHAYGELDKGLIEINITEDDSNYILSYKDDGKGIPAKNQPKVFDAFFTTDKQVGTGLGMNITYNLITQKLGGKITLWSEEGNGVLFTITIPKAGVVA